MRHAIILSTMSVFILSGCAGMYPLVGLDKDGNTILARVNEEKYAENLADGLASVQESVIPALDEKASGDTKWKLRTAVVGFGIRVQGGIGPFTAGVTPRVRAAFANGANPPIP